LLRIISGRKTLGSYLNSARWQRPGLITLIRSWLGTVSLDSITQFMPNDAVEAKETKLLAKIATPLEPTHCLKKETRLRKIAA
jgi:hypothetical protein